MIIRKAVLSDAPGIAKVHVDSWRTTYKGIFPDSFLDKLSYESRTSLWKDNIAAEGDPIYIAETKEGQVVGFASGSKRETNKDSESGDLTSLYILEEYQRHGIGKKLMKELVTKLSEHGCTSLYVEVIADNQATHFYELLGAKLHLEEQMSVKGEDVDVIIYKWESIDDIQF
ncbi:GNAT family N-acetyltransferase [Alkalicoccobacillus murimartini]|uniref:Ribosomal protein S18 acetylase RimI-like enzyme n=1 Tax=Alkalicoccobacillus murimartini TaxID=171685 RepID=A0ABT9YLR1_9BACI|nr:GNAT family N-acetyltransferase [Alkalicoccobacillus murimartini]MDQ0208790.1 ribosomal protein S18 acetylase RimI-like enzyme [Alkalicoccobacillus murimartini]